MTSTLFPRHLAAIVAASACCDCRSRAIPDGVRIVIDAGADALTIYAAHGALAIRRRMELGSAGAPQAALDVVLSPDAVVAMKRVPKGLPKGGLRQSAIPITLTWEGKSLIAAWGGWRAPLPLLDGTYPNIDGAFDRIMGAPTVRVGLKPALMTRAAIALELRPDDVVVMSSDEKGYNVIRRMGEPASDTAVVLLMSVTVAS